LEDKQPDTDFEWDSWSDVDLFFDLDSWSDSASSIGIMSRSSSSFSFTFVASDFDPESLSLEVNLC
jgi:hypothetical protein